METLSQEFAAGLPDAATFPRLSIRLALAAVLGAIVGYDRERMGKPAGLRTHMLVCMGATLFVLAPSQTGMAIADVSRVIQGLAAGVGFLGGGAILKLSAEREILGTHHRRDNLDDGGARRHHRPGPYRPCTCRGGLNVDHTEPGGVAERADPGRRLVCRGAPARRKPPTTSDAGESAP